VALASAAVTGMDSAAGYPRFSSLWVRQRPTLRPGLPWDRSVAQWRDLRFLPVLTLAKFGLESQLVLFGIQLFGIHSGNLLQVVDGLEVPVLLSILNDGLCLSRGKP
jgi:hypothetical protein